jgi:hypothetical protein
LSNHSDTDVGQSKAGISAGLTRLTEATSKRSTLEKSACQIFRFGYGKVTNDKKVPDSEAPSQFFFEKRSNLRARAKFIDT